ncbi:MAG TPA: methylated-DNA--[protein]-cysteine S-methyltransferase [Thermoanaerobaculia bacterium]
MNEVSFALFDTAIGACGIAWGPGGVLGLWLPGPGAGATRRRLLGRLPGAGEAEPPPGIRSAIEGCRALLRGEAADLSDVRIDEAGVPEFHRRVYAVARTISPGRTLTYGEIARRLGDPLEARAVGHALGQNPFPLVVPCHRVLAANGKTGGFSAPGGAATKLRLLEIEGARAPAIPTLFS